VKKKIWVEKGLTKISAKNKKRQGDQHPTQNKNKTKKVKEQQSQTAKLYFGVSQRGGKGTAQSQRAGTVPFGT